MSAIAHNNEVALCVLNIMCNHILYSVNVLHTRKHIKLSYTHRKHAERRTVFKQLADDGGVTLVGGFKERSRTILQEKNYSWWQFRSNAMISQFWYDYGNEHRDVRFSARDFYNTHVSGGVNLCSGFQ